MKTVRRMVYNEVVAAVGLTTLAFLALFSFIDLVEELRSVGTAGPDGYQIRHALAFVGTLAVSSLYELLPITVLIGSVFVMARMAQNSEFTVLRTSGLDPWRALRTMLGLGLAFTLLTFAVGDFLVPVADRAGQFLKARYLHEITVGQTGAWLREKQADRSFWVNVGALQPDGGMRRIRIIEFDDAGKLVSTSQAARGEFSGVDAWLLHDVQRTEFAPGPDSQPQARSAEMAEFRWPTTLTSEMAAVALLKPDRMPIIDLFQFMRHLEANDQASQRYEIELWRKVFYPLSCLVMVVLALPFAYLHFRSGGVAGYVFLGVMVGISFFLLNNLFGYVGNLRAWDPVLAAAAPAMLYSLASLGAFGWLVLRR